MTEENAAPEPEAEAEESTDTEVEFQTLLGRATKARQTVMALASQKGVGGADALRQLGGTVLVILEDLIASCGGALCAIEDQLMEAAAESEGGLSEDDAASLYLTLTANLNMLDSVSGEAVASLMSDEQKTAMAALREMNRQSRDLVVELSGLDEAELADLAKPEEEAENPEEQN